MTKKKFWRNEVQILMNMITVFTLILTMNKS